MSTSNYYALFVQQVLELAQTLVIKSEATAQAQNKYVVDYFGAAALSQGDPTTWKYYLNLAGEYHPTDTIMTVVSSDTLEQITFSKQNLQVHRSTARHYQWGTRQYKELVERFPTQERLILGILYPVNLTDAIAARDGAILGYPPGLVEENEYSLIPKLQQWIDRWMARWFVSAFTLSDELYAATALGTMYLLLVPAIITMRKEACKTNEAHSFHVRQYLASHGFLDAYVDSLTLKQRLFFYRNIAYIERNAGKRDTFDWLVEHIMSERGFPIAEYTMRHDLSSQPQDVYPTLSFRRKQLNLGYTLEPNSTISLPQVLFKERGLARDNALYEDHYEPIIERVMENSRSNVMHTKLLESVMVDYSNSTAHTLTEVLMNEWLSQAATGTYQAYVSITNPATGEDVPLTVKEAFIFVWYAFCRTIGITLETIPKMYAAHVQRTPMATRADLLSIVDNTLITSDLADQVLSKQPVIVPVISTDAFYDLCYQIYTASQFQRNLTAFQQHNVRRAMVQAMCERVYCDKIVELAPEGTTYASWFAARNLNVSALTSAELAILYYGLVQDATGMALHPTSSLAALQRAMVKMLSQLSSYSIQIAAEINTSAIKRTDWTAVRVGDVLGHSSDHEKFPDAVVGVVDYSGSGKDKVSMPISMPGQHKLLSERPLIKWSYDIHTETEIVVNQRYEPGNVRVANVRTHYATQPASNTEGIIPSMGYETSFLDLNETERAALRDVYNSQFMPSAPGVAGDLAANVTVTVLDGIHWVPANAMLDENGLPMLDQNGDFIVANP